MDTMPDEPKNALYYFLGLLTACAIIGLMTQC
jgi:hypothetical protein